eukprot:scpid97500/ scgid9699/ Barrier-to-autointegration factor
MAQSSPTGVDGSPNLKHPPKKNTVESVTLDEDGSLIVRIRIHVPSTPSQVESSTLDTVVEGVSNLKLPSTPNSVRSSTPQIQTTPNTGRSALHVGSPDTTDKHQKFVKERMGTKAVTALPGIETRTGKNLANSDYTTAWQIFKVYLDENMDLEPFKGTMKKLGQMNADNAEGCYKALHAYYEAHGAKKGP